MTAEAGDAAPVHHALHEVVALHPVLVRRAVGEVRERRLAQLVVFELPEILELARPGESRPASRSTGPRSDSSAAGPASGTGCRCRSRGRNRASRDSRCSLTVGLRDVLAARSVASLAADVPLGDRLRLDVVVDRVTAVAERSGRPLACCRPDRTAPTSRCSAATKYGAPDLVRHVPLRRQRKVVVADLREIALLPLRSVDERDVVELERQERIRLREIGNDGLRMQFRIERRRWPCASSTSVRRWRRDRTGTPSSRRSCGPRAAQEPARAPQRAGPDATVRPTAFVRSGIGPTSQPRTVLRSRRTRSSANVVAA